MPTVQQHMAALQAARAAGDEEAVQYIRGQLVAAQQEADRAEYNPAAGQSAGRLFLEGMGQGAMNIVRNVGNMAGVVSDERMAEAAAQDAPLLATGAGKAGAFAGETAAVTLPTMGVAGLAGRVGGLASKVAANTLGRGALEGAAHGAIVAGPNDRMAGAVQGAAFGAVLPAAGATYRAARSGVRPTASARRLMDRGIELTPGQMNPRGSMNQLEEVTQALPVVGSVVREARGKGMRQFHHTIAQDVAPPGVRVAAKETVTDMVDDVYKAYGKAYDFAKGYPMSPHIIRTSGGDIPLVSFPKQPGALERAVRDRSIRADDATRKSVHSWLQNRLTQLPGKGRGNVAMQSDDLLKLRSDIRDEIRKAGKSGEEAARDLLRNAEKKVTEVLDSQFPPEVSAALKSTDGQYGKFKIFEDAVYRAKDQAGSFTPAQFSQAVRDATQKAEYARGGGRMRDLSRSAVDVFQDRQPMTGRQVLTAGPVLAAAAANPVTIGAPLALGTGLMYGTKAGNALAAGRTGVQQGARAVERKVRRAVPKGAREGVARLARAGTVNALLAD